MSAPAISANSVLHPAYHAVRELFIGDETQTSQAASKFGWGVAPVAASAREAITQTYSTADGTVPNVTYSVYTVTTVATAVTKTNSSPYGFSSGDADKVVTALAAIPTDLAGLQVEIAAIAADHLATKKNLNKIVDALQALGLLT